MTVDRRSLLTMAAALGAAGAAQAAAGEPRPTGRRGIRQGLTRMTLGDELSVEECCRLARRLGVQGLDFFSDPRDWPTLRNYDLICSMVRADYGGGSSKGGPSPVGPPGWKSIGMKEAQGAYLEAVDRLIDVAADNGIPNIILLCGTRAQVPLAQGADNAVDFCRKIAAHAERRNVVLCMELINSTGVGGPAGYLFDHAAWGFDVCRRIGSSHVKVLFDIYHAQVMDGNLADTISKNIAMIGHFHVGGVPHRHELDDSQEINYGFLVRTIAATGYDGFISHEWTPSPGGNRFEKIEKSVRLVRDASRGPAPI